MTLSDVTLLGKKILVGILVALLPFLILFWSLRLTQKLLGSTPKVDASVQALK